MNFATSYAFALIWLAYLIASGVLLFSRGFLLSRVSRTDVSSCRRLSNNPNDEYFLSEDIVKEIFKDVNATSNLCLPPKSKVIMLVIDALKYEFGVYKENVSESPLPYENKLSVLHELLLSAPQRTRMLRFRADPPTTTLQRLKGMTTGSLPTFIDVGSNFASPEINEDNIIDQMVRHDVPVVFLGDNTWTDLYPRRFKRSYAYPSFDIFDLDTVDNEIQKHLPKELARNDWQVLIAHFLGVDHCGHKHGPLHTEMERKLSEMNSMIRSVIDQMDNETTLMIMGDHGMTLSGDHGGESEDEINALLFAYSKQYNFVSNTFGLEDEMMQQIDLVPTLATILGIPIPYSNLGLINFNIVPDVAVPYMSDFQILLLHAWQNAQQMYKYFHNYALENERTFSIAQLDHLNTEFMLLMHRVKTVYNAAGFKSFASDLKTELRLILSTCRDIWVKFEPTQMSQGLVMTFIPVFFMFLLVNNLRPHDYYQVFTPKLLAYVYLINVAAVVFGYRFYHHGDFKSGEHGAIFCSNMLSTGILALLAVQNWTAISTNWSLMKRFDKMPTRLVCLICLSVYFSNSFIIQEPKILSYLLVGTLMLLAYELLHNCIHQDYKIKFRLGHFLKSVTFRLLLTTLLAIVSVRVTYTLFRCREEQGNCDDFSNDAAATNAQKAQTEIYILSVVIIVLYTTLTRLYLRACGNLTGYSLHVQMARYGPTVGSICAGGHLLLTNSSLKNIQRSHVDAMALVIYAVLLLEILVVSFAPLMTYVAKPQSLALPREGGIIPEIYRKIKNICSKANGPNDRRYMIPVVYGLATIYSSTIISFGLFLAMVLFVLLGAKSSLGLVFCIVVAAILLVLHAFLRIRTAISFETCIQPTFTAIVCWFLLAHFCFFATSHQTTLSQIDWRAAFVGRSSSIGNSHLISAILVILSTFCGQIFFMCTYGLLSTETFSVFALFPQLIKSQCNRDLRKREAAINDPRLGPSPVRSASEISSECLGFDMTRGELILYENECEFLGTAFKLASQFFMMQGIKVFCSMMACTIHCRHLMVWKIFAPRFIYESLATFVSLPALIIGYLLYVRIHFAVDKLIGSINKMK